MRDLSWVGTWSQSLSDHSFLQYHGQNQTLRAVIRISLGGSQVRVRFSNRYGKQPLKIDEASIALAGDGISIQSHTIQQITFSSQADVTLSEGSEVISDPVVLPVPALARLAVSIYFEQPVAFETANLGQGDIYGSIPGNHVVADNEPFLPFSPVQVEQTGIELPPPLPFIAGIDVLTAAHSRAIVAFGDSITAGGWPAMLAERLNGLGMAHVGVLNQGLGGNRVLHSGVGPIGYAFGLAGVTRFQRDVLEQAGVRSVIVLHGINDIIHPGVIAPKEEEVSAQEIVSGMEQYATWAHEKNIRIIVANLLPFEGHQDWKPEREDKLQMVNALIQSSQAFDGILDLAAVMRDPAFPTRLLPAYDSGDHLHPDPQGLRAIAEAVDLNWFI